MTIEEILKALAHTDRKFPREALQQAIHNKDEITPHLLKILEKAIAHPDEILEADDFSHLYALYLLAQFREKRAYPLVIRLASLDAKTVDNLLGETITIGLGRILASVYDGDMNPIAALAENPEAEAFVRGAALRALLFLAVNGEIARERVIEYYASLFDKKLEAKANAGIVWAELVGYATDLHPGELYDQIKKAFEEELVDESILDLEWVDRFLARDKEDVLAEIRQDRRHQLITDAIGEMEWWHWYEKPGKEQKIGMTKEERRDVGQKAHELQKMLNPPPPRTPAIAPTKVGRNEPCPCGSGKKYKKCHGA